MGTLRWLFVLGLLLPLTGCNLGGGESELLQSGMDSQVTVTDQRGKEVSISQPVERVVTVPMPAASLVYTIDGTAERIVGMHPASKTAIEEGILGKIAPGLLEVESGFISQGFEVNTEELLKLEPEVVLQWGNRGEDLIAPLDNLGIATLGLDYGTQEDLEIWISLLGKVLGREDRAMQLTEWQRQWMDRIGELTAVLEEGEMQNVLYLSPVESLRTVGGDTYNQMYFELTGVNNVAYETSGFNEVTMEQVLAWDPEIIYVGNFGELTSEAILENSIDGQDWSTVNAVQNGRVYQIPLGGYRWDPPSQESPLMWLWLMEVQHPGLGKFDLVSEMRNFYLDFYGYELTDVDIQSILRCSVGRNRDLSVCQAG